MAHLLKFRKGWENENLAQYILSKFSFVSQPTTIADDVGADYFCTFFKKVIIERISREKKAIKDVFIYPQGSFAIQIKSSRRKFSLNNKLDFLDNLQLPFFIGVISQRDLSMTVYSGDIIPRYFSLVGLPPSKKNRNIDVKAGFFENRENNPIQPRQKEYVIPFFKLGKISASDAHEENAVFIEKFARFCKVYQENIVAKKKHEYLFHDPETLEAGIVYGPGSYQVSEIISLKDWQRFLPTFLGYALK